MESYTPNLSNGQAGRVVFQVVAPSGRKIVLLSVFVGPRFHERDGAGWTVKTDNGALVRGLSYQPSVSGNLIVTAMDEETCEGSTGAPRLITVK